MNHKIKKIVLIFNVNFTLKEMLAALLIINRPGEGGEGLLPLLHGQII